MSIMWDWAYGKGMDTQPGHVHDKVTLITGADSDMGESHARILASQGANFALADIADDKGTELAKDLTGTSYGMESRCSGTQEEGGPRSSTFFHRGDRRL